MENKMIINTDRDEYKSFNGFECIIVNTHREDGYVEVFVPAFNILILLLPHELED